MSVQAPALSDDLPWQMRFVPCVLCGGESFQTIYGSRLPPLGGHDIHQIFACTSSLYGECGPIVRCTGCGLVLQNPQPDPETILGAYRQVVDFKYAEEREGRIHTFRRALEELGAHAAPGRLLDVGSHVGIFIEVAREQGWDAEGVELSNWAVEVGRSRGLPVSNGTVADLRVPDGWYDAVTLWDVIEHLAEPAEELRRIHRVLRPGGVLAMSTMDVEAPISRLLGRYWPWYMQMHLFYFSRRSIGRLVEQCGYRVLEVRRHRRIVRVGYLYGQFRSRLGPLAAPLGSVLERTGIARRLVGVDLGDIFTLFAAKDVARNGSS